MPAGIAGVGSRVRRDGGGAVRIARSGHGITRFLRIDSPFSAILCAVCTTRSRIASASVGSLSDSCHALTGNCLVISVVRVPTRSSSNSSRSLRSAA